MSRRVVDRGSYVITTAPCCGAFPVRDSGDVERHAENFLAPCRCSMRVCIRCEAHGHLTASGERCPGNPGVAA